jgi:hypothetical protein
VALSVFWLLYLGAFGILLPFFSLYLSDNAGLTGTEVGAVVTMFPLAHDGRARNVRPKEMSHGSSETR